MQGKGMTGELTRKIIHIDMDCFYASIEMRDNPQLQGKPVAVGGLPTERGVLSTCNYEARKFGLHSAMPTALAFKKCPQLILRPVNMPLYRQVSQQILQIFHEYTPIVEPLSLDEAYLDVTNVKAYRGSATWIAQSIRQQIFQTTGLTASAGVAPLKFLAKIASDQNKPNGLFVIRPEDVEAFIYGLPLKKIPSVGKVTEGKLHELGLYTCADVQQQTLLFLQHHFGKLGTRIWQFSHGKDPRAVQPQRERKSVGVERTVIQDFATLNQAEPLLERLFELLKQRLARTCPTIPLQQLHRLSVKLKFDDFQQTTVEKSHLDFNLASFQHLLTQAWLRCNNRAVRLIGLQVQLPHQKSMPRQLSLWD